MQGKVRIELEEPQGTLTKHHTEVGKTRCRRSEIRSGATFRRIILVESLSCPSSNVDWVFILRDSASIEVKRGRTSDSKIATDRYKTRSTYYHIKRHSVTYAECNFSLFRNACEITVGSYLTSLGCHPRQCGRSHPIEDRDWDGIMLLSTPCRILCACILELLCVIYKEHGLCVESKWLTVIRNKFIVMLRRRRLFDIRRHCLTIRGIF